MDAAALRAVPRRGMIVREGGPCAGLYVVLGGVVQLCRTATSGRSLVLRLVRAGESFGEEVLLAQRGQGARCRTSNATADRTARAPTDASAATAVRLLVIPAEAVQAALASDVALAEEVLATLAQRVLYAYRRQGELVLQSPAERIAHYLLGHARTSAEGAGPPVVRLDVPKVTLAHYLGTVPEVLARHLRRFEEAGALRRAGDALVLTDVAALRHGADGLRRRNVLVTARAF